MLFTSARPEHTSTLQLEHFADLCMRINAKAVALREVNMDTAFQRGITRSRLVLQRYLRRTFTVGDLVGTTACASELLCVRG